MYLVIYVVTQPLVVIPAVCLISLVGMVLFPFHSIEWWVVAFFAALTAPLVGPIFVTYQISRDRKKGSVA